MTLARRLERLTPALSVRERFLMALDEYRSGKRIGVDLSGMSPSQEDEYLDYARLVTSFNLISGSLWPLISERAAWLDDDLDRIAVLDLAADDIEVLNGWPRSEPARNWRKAGEISVPAFLRGLALEQRGSVAVGADHLWQELRAAEALLAEATDELGEDITHPTTRASFAEARQAVADLRRRLGLKKEPKPDAAVLDHFRACLDAARGVEEIEAPR